jgi:malate dehydrogenase
LKISIIGSGNIGSCLTWLLAKSGAYEVWLLDKLTDLAQARASDISNSLAIADGVAKVNFAQSYSDIEQSEIVVLTAGFTRRPGESRDDLFMRNAEVVKEVAQAISHFSPECLLVVVTNPLDAMCYCALKASNLAAKKIIGMAGILDASRFKLLLGEKLKVRYAEIETVIIGEHGDTMVILPRLSKVAGKPLMDLLSPQEISELMEKTRKFGAQIVAWQGASAYFAPAEAVFNIIENISQNRRQPILASVYCEGQYGIRDLFIGLPAIISSKGVEEIITLDLNQEEKSQLRASAEKISKETEKLNKLFKYPASP